MKRVRVLVVALAGLSLALPVSAVVAATGTTTYAEQTQNNTSTCEGTSSSPTSCAGTFPGQTDTHSGVETPVFDPAATDVSTSDVHSRLYSGNTTKIFATMMLGFCVPGTVGSDGVTRCNGSAYTHYPSNDTATVDAQLRDLAQRGFNGAMMSWYGPGTNINAAALKFQAEIKNEGYCPLGAQKCRLMYDIMYDGSTLLYPVSATGIPGTTGAGCTSSTPNLEDCVVGRLRNDICYMNGYHFGNDAYQKYDLGDGKGNRPMLLFFIDEGMYGSVLPSTGPAPSWADVWYWVRQWSNNLPANCASTPYNGNNGIPMFVFRNSSGFTHAQSDGSFAWPNPTTNQDDLNIDPATTGGTLSNFYSTSVNYRSSKAVWGSAWKGFNSSQALWGTGRYIDQRCGMTWINSMAAANAYYSTANQLPFLQVATWNDYDEGTAVETGIDNCYRVSAGVNGNTLSWSLNAQSSYASTSTVEFFKVFDSTDGGATYSEIADLSTSARTYDLSGLPAGTHQLFVKMCGRPNILDRSSSVVTFTH
jgi:hypothetical protein